MGGDYAPVHQGNLVVGLYLDVIHPLDEGVAVGADGGASKLFDQLVELRVAGPRDVAAAPVVVPVRNFLAGKAHEVLLRVDVRAGGIHLDVGEEAAVDGILVGYGIAAEVDCGVVVKDFGLDADLRPPVADEGLGVLPDVVSGGLEGDS